MLSWSRWLQKRTTTAAALGPVAGIQAERDAPHRRRDLARWATPGNHARPLRCGRCRLGASSISAAGQFAERHGQPWHQDAGGRWRRTEFCVLGLGKLAGRSLNYSSDVTCCLSMRDEGQVFREPPAKSRVPRAVLASHPFFNRLAEAFIAEVARLTSEGICIALICGSVRRRFGPPLPFLASYENYYAQWGQTGAHDV